MVSKEIDGALPAIRRFMQSQPIDRAWLFGSCSRGEETPASDIDILVDYSKGARITLFTISRMICSLGDLLNRRVDIVERDCLLPFAKESVNKDKLLIYERDDTGQGTA